MTRASTQQKASTKRSWGIRAINVIGAIAVTSVVLWETGLTSKEWWDSATAPKAIPIAKAPPRSPTKAIGTAPLIPKGNDTSNSHVTLQLILVETHPGMNVHEGIAQMGTVRESPQTYQAGALLENGARLAEIHPDYVLLQRDGRSVRLYLETASVPAKTSGNAMAMVGPAQYSRAPVNAPTREIVTDYMRPSPVYDGEALLGYQIYPGKKSGPFAQMGLRSADLIVAIDGMLLTDPAIAWDMFRQLADGNVHSASIKRSGAAQELILNGEFIAKAEEDAGQQPSRAMLTPPPP